MQHLIAHKGSKGLDSTVRSLTSRVYRLSKLPSANADDILRSKLQLSSVSRGKQKAQLSRTEKTKQQALFTAFIFIAIQNVINLNG